MNTFFPTDKETTEYLLSIVIDTGNIDAIIFLEALKNDVTLADIIKGSREQGLVKIRRQIATKANKAGHNPETIAKHLDKDRTTIIHYLDTNYEADK